MSAMGFCSLQLSEIGQSRQSQVARPQQTDLNIDILVRKAKILYFRTCAHIYP